jgi:DNA-binding response OmpR family regulator
MAALIPFVSEKYALSGQFLPPVATETTPPLPATVSPTVRILIVSNDPEVCRICRAALLTDGIVCDESVNGELALQAVETATPDLVLLDVNLPGITGLEVLKQLCPSPLKADRKIIVLVDSDCEIRSLMAAGADDYQIKPIDGAELQARVEAVLHLKKTKDPSPPDPLNEAEIENRRESAANASFWQRSLNWMLGRKKTSIPPDQ